MKNLSPITSHRFFAAVLAGCALFATVPPAGAADPSYAVVARWKLGGAGGWDYLTIDSARGRLFVTRGDRVEVLDAATGKVLGVVPGTQGVHGVALAPDLKRGYTSNGRGNSVTEFDYDSLAVLRELPISGQNPDAIVYDVGTHRVVTFNGRSKDATVIDATTFKVVATLPMPDKPEFAASDGAGHLYVNIESEAGQILAIDAAKPSITATWPLPGCASPSGIALDSDKKRLFSVCDGKVMVVTDAADGRQLARVAIGSGPDAAEFDAARGLAFSSNGEGSLTIVRADSRTHYEVAQTLHTQRGARTMALDPATRRIYLATAEFGPAPAATPEQPHPRPAMIPDSFTILVAAPR